MDDGTEVVAVERCCDDKMRVTTNVAATKEIAMVWK